MNKKNKNKKESKINTKLFNGVLIFFVISSYLINLALENHAATQRYQVSKFLTEYRQLQAENQKMSVTVAELQSSSRLTAESERLNLVKASTVRYLTTKGAVVLNK